MHECNRTINDTVMTFKCPLMIENQELRLYDLTTAQLDSIISLIARGDSATSSGPFTEIPANICLLRNLQVIYFDTHLLICIELLLDNRFFK